MVSLVDSFESSFVYFIIFTVTLIALWSYVILSKKNAHPLDPSVLKKEEFVNVKKSAKNCFKNKRTSPERKQVESRNQVENKSKISEAKLSPKIAKQKTSDVYSQDNVDPVPLKPPSTGDKMDPHNSLTYSKQKGKRKTATKRGEQQLKDTPINVEDSEGGWTVQLSRQQLRAHKDQQRQNETLKENISSLEVTLCKKQSDSEEQVGTSLEVTTDNVVDNSPNAGVDLNAHCDIHSSTLSDIESALEEAADSLPNPEANAKAPHVRSDQQTVQIAKLDTPDPDFEQPSVDQAEDKDPEDWIIV